jgi:hypothetical protein
MESFSQREQLVYGLWGAVGVTILIVFVLASAYVKHAPLVEAKRAEMSTVGQRTVSDPLSPATIAVPNPRE